MSNNYNIPLGVNAISFDVWRTLLRGNKAFTWKRLELIFGHIGILDYDREAITEAYIEAEKCLNRKAEDTGVDIGMAERIELVLLNLGITGKAIPDEETIYMLQSELTKLRMLPEFRPPLTEPDLIETLRNLKAAGYKLGTLSNTSMEDSGMMARVFEYYGFDELFSVKLFSCDDGRAKPNPGFFLRMARELEVMPSRVLHVGDSVNADCRAVEAGLESVLYDPKGVCEDMRYPTISSLRELLPR